MIWWFWRGVARILVAGKNDSERARRINWWLPAERSPAERDVREKVRQQIERLAMLALAGSLAALATLGGFTEWLKVDGSSFGATGYAFAWAAVSAAAAVLLSIVEPAFRVRVASRLEAPDDPEDEGSYFYALDDFVFAAPGHIRNALEWRFVSALKVLALLCTGGMLAVGLFSAVSVFTAAAPGGAHH